MRWGAGGSEDLEGGPEAEAKEEEEVETKDEQACWGLELVAQETRRGSRLVLVAATYGAARRHLPRLSR